MNLQSTKFVDKKVIFYQDQLLVLDVQHLLYIYTQ